jgi:hypothetical protein
MTYPRLYLDIETYRPKGAFEGEKIIACGFLLDKTDKVRKSLSHAPEIILLR